MAGESARESARRQLEKAERLRRSAELWEQGAAGEEATATALSALPSAEWTSFHDVRWPGRRFANVDHVVVGPPGVFVIDSKNWSGSIVVRDHVLRQNGRSRETAVSGTAEAALAIAQLAREVPATHVHAVLCFVRDEAIAGWARDVMVCSTGNVVQMLLSRPAALSPEERQRIAVDLDASLREAVGSSASAVPSRPPVVAQQLKPVPLPAAPSRPQRRSGGRHKSRSGGLVKALVAFSFVGAMAFVPGAREAVGSGIASLLMPDEVPTSEQSPKKTEPDRPQRPSDQRPKD